MIRSLCVLLKYNSSQPGILSGVAVSFRLRSRGMPRRTLRLHPANECGVPLRVRVGFQDG